MWVRESSSALDSRFPPSPLALASCRRKQDEASLSCGSGVDDFLSWIGGKPEHSPFALDKCPGILLTLTALFLAPLRDGWRLTEVT